MRKKVPQFYRKSVIRISGVRRLKEFQIAKMIEEEDKWVFIYLLESLNLSHGSRELIFKI